MGMQKTHDLAVSTGEYQDNHGATKKRWMNVGALLRDPQDGRVSIKLEGLPVGNEWNGWISAFPADQQHRQQQQSGGDEPY